ncbi:PAS domain-containing sensor histidine kinase [Dactylosporangium sp. NPDC000555]|uniref:PAS domain-containing sensor histidine kinase n=1 Tax=Dactylosporangium sp. NPDC000555 TaxID=3154260 RepID=UPI003333D44A
MLISDEPGDIAIDHRGVIRSWPEAAAELFGHERSWAVGSAFAHLLLPPRLRDAELPPGVELDVAVLHADGREMRAALRVRPTEHGRAVAFRPLSSRTPPDAELYLRAARSAPLGEEPQRGGPGTGDEDLAERHRLLSELSQLRTEFIRVASHELRTPLTSIVTFATMLEADDGMTALSRADRQAALGVIRRNADRMQVLVADLLLLSRLETAEAPLDLAPLRIAELLDFPGVPLRAGPGPDLMGDRALLRELFHTAVEVAAIAGPAEVDAAFAGGRWRVVVSVENGSGLTAERLLSMRIPHPEQPEEYRTGALALMLGREIAARHGGAMLTSVDRPGVTVRVTLPVA